MTIQETAHSIIDLVELKIRQLYPQIEKLLKFPDNTLLVGEDYYDLENDVIVELKNLMEECK